jgi:hypothetical protein
MDTWWWWRTAKFKDMYLPLPSAIGHIAGARDLTEQPSLSSRQDVELLVKVAEGIGQQDSS